jgi:hypothetical protein
MTKGTFPPNPNYYVYMVDVVENGNGNLSCEAPAVKIV